VLVECGLRLVDGGMIAGGGGSAGGREVSYVVDGWSSLLGGLVGEDGISRAAK
jgi:hypothetical protein